MVIITSFAPSHKNSEAQQFALESWIKTGYRIISVNHIDEIKQLSQYKGVEFFEPEKTGIDTFGKHYVPISELIKIVIKEGRGLIINSDIIIKSLPELGDNAFVFNRYDFEDSTESAKIFVSGYDGFYLTADHCKEIPESRLCLGQCHWDYWLPLILLSKKIRLSNPTIPYLYHKKHDLQYNNKSWETTALIFKQETGIGGSLPKVSDIAFKYIKSKTHLV